MPTRGREGLRWHARRHARRHGWRGRPFVTDAPVVVVVVGVHATDQVVMRLDTGSTGLGGGGMRGHV